MRHNIASPANIHEPALVGSIIKPPSIDTDIDQKDNAKGNRNSDIENSIDVMPHLASGDIDVDNIRGSSLIICILLLIAILYP